MNNSRYYEPNPTDDIKPGKISEELKKALNIPDNDIPIWIYRMRALGYPPGWLKKAIVESNDIFEADVTPNSNKRSHDQQEQEEIQYDHSKLIEYPGFNAPLPPGVNDYHYYVNMPGMLEHQQLEYAKKHMKRPPPETKRARSDFNTSIDSQQASHSSKAMTSHVDQKIQVKHEMFGSQPQPSTSSATKIKLEPNKSSKIEEKSNEESESTSSEDANDTTSDSLTKDPVSKTKDVAKLVSKGSPMPKLDRQPLERFSEGVTTELLYFENIANSTGRFDNIRGLLNTMRKSL